jgi:hypothetical protein
MFIPTKFPATNNEEWSVANCMIAVRDRNEAERVTAGEITINVVGQVPDLPDI